MTFYTHSHRTVRYQVPRYSGWKPRPLGGAALHVGLSDTKYRDIADGNSMVPTKTASIKRVRYQVPRYSGWKPSRETCKPRISVVRYQVPRYSGWKRPVIITHFLSNSKSDTKYRDIADGNGQNDGNTVILPYRSDTKYRDIAATNQLPREKFLHVRQFSRTMTD